MWEKKTTLFLPAETSSAMPSRNGPDVAGGHDSLLGPGKHAVPRDAQEVEGIISTEGSLDREPDESPASVCETFQYADKIDVLLMCFGGIAATAVGASLPAFSFVFGRMIDNLFRQVNPERETAKSALIMVYVGGGVVVFATLYVACWLIAATRQTGVIRSKYMESVLRQDIGWHDEHSSGSLTSRITGDALVLQNGINDKLGQGIMNLSMGIWGFVFGFVFSWELTLAMLGMMPFIALMGAIMAKLMSRMATGAREHFAVAGSVAMEAMENVRTVQTFGREEYELGRFRDAVLNSQKATIKKEFTSSLAAGGTMAIVFITYTVSFFFASYLVEWERRTVGDTVACFLSVLMGSFGFGYISSSWSAFTESRSVARHFFDTINRVPTIDVDTVGVPMREFHDSIEFRHVRFTYPTRQDMKLFADLSLVIKRGQKVAFSGASGCGKSSIISLIQRFYDPSDGVILVDGTDLRKLSLKEWRDKIGIVSQEPRLLDGTIMENVRVGKADATDEEVMEACKQANIHETIMSLPDNYNTPVGAVGSQLSGGQKQRLAIARAIVRRPDILLLDEATSALDRKSEVEVQAALDRLMEQGSMTVIIVAHRLATIRNVDCIYYFSYDSVRGSTIEEVGTFDALLARGEMFAAMAMAQGIGPASYPKTHSLSLNKNSEGLVNTFLDDDDLVKLDTEEPRTERQKVPYEELADWEVKQTRVTMNRLISLAKDKRVHVGFACVGSMITGGAAPISGILFGRILSVLGQYGVDHDKSALRSGTNSCAPLFLVMAFGTLLGWLLQFFYGYSGEHLTTRLRILLFRQILRQDMSFFDIPGRDAGALSGMLSGDCEAVHQLWGPSIGLKLQTFCTIVVGLIVGFIYQWKLALVALVCLPFVALANLAQQMLAMGATQKKEGNTSDALVTEALLNMRTVTSFNLRDNYIAMYNEKLQCEVSREIRRNALIGLAYGISQFMFYGAFALCFWYGGRLIGAGEATFEEVLTTSMAVLMGAMGAGEAGGFASKTAHAREAARRVFSVIDRVPDVDVFRGGARVQGDGFDIAFRNVQFIYPARPRQLVLTSVDVDFARGTSNGVMGQTGCGKSTIIQMLARFYDNRGGKITVNDTDLRDLDVAAWRANISIVMQEPDLFGGTVRENIRYSRPSATDAEVEEAARLACIHDDISRWPEGYDTQVGYRGRSLSGGQKQRVAVARALLRGAQILLLDEATTALDNVTEARLQRNIDAYQRRHRITVISIAHRLTTIRHSDQITLLDSGRVIECGDHDYLMSLDGEYKRRWELYANTTI